MLRQLPSSMLVRCFLCPYVSSRIFIHSNRDVFLTHTFAGLPCAFLASISISFITALILSMVYFLQPLCYPTQSMHQALISLYIMIHITHHLARDTYTDMFEHCINYLFYHLVARYHVSPLVLLNI